MSEIELNSYRFSSGEDPSDEMLEAITKEVAKETKERKEKSYKLLMKRIQLEISNVN